MAAITLPRTRSSTAAVAAEALYQRLPSYAVPLFVRVVDELEQTSTFKSRKVELRKQGYARRRGTDSCTCWPGRSDGYIASYDGYVDEVAAGSSSR